MSGAGMLAAVLALAGAAAGEEGRYGPLSPEAWGRFNMETVVLARCVREARDAAGDDWMPRLEASGLDGEFRDLVLRLVPAGTPSLSELEAATAAGERFMHGMVAMWQAPVRNEFDSTLKLAVMTYYELSATQGRCVAPASFLETYRKSLP